MKVAYGIGRKRKEYSVVQCHLPMEAKLGAIPGKIRAKNVGFHTLPTAARANILDFHFVVLSPRIADRTA